MDRRSLLLGAAACHGALWPFVASAEKRSEISFRRAFPRKIYQKKFFGFAVTGTTILAAGVFSYLTAGAGAPIAATGVSTVAAWVGGGGAGSYMAGLATIGGWFGGNAMVGAAVLNGISLGTVGGLGVWKTLSATQKAMSIASTAATAMDGIALVKKPDVQQLEWRILLPIPVGLASKPVRQLVESLDEAGSRVASLAEEAEIAKREANQPNSGLSAYKKLKDIRENLSTAREWHAETSKRVNDAIAHTVRSGSSDHDAIVVAVLAHNSGDSSQFRTLLSRIKPDSQADQSYLNYLRAIAALQTGKTPDAVGLLDASRRQAPYAIEPVLLLVSILGSRDYPSQERKIKEVVREAGERFDSDAYIPVASTVALRYRVGIMAYENNRCEWALESLQMAQKKMPIIEERLTRKDVRNLLEISQANALHCLGKKAEANKLFDAVKGRTEGADAKELLCVQFVGGCKPA